MMLVYIIIGVGCLALVVAFIRHQQKLSLRARLMQEAIRNRDFMFRLSTKGLPPGERDMQETLNQLGNTIRQQINQNEVEAWERLTRVLTHEIMNATAPIASISQSLLQRNDVKGTALEEGIHAIYTTSLHLNNFVDSYRKFSQLQKPVLKDYLLTDLTSPLPPLYPTVNWQISIAPHLLVHADSSMMQQILINLTKNAIEAGASSMGITARETDNAVIISVSNNGQPIAADARCSIFVPFFTTKRTGNGIGLSLCRRMMIQQNGSLELAERPLSPFHTTFILTLAKIED